MFNVSQVIAGFVGWHFIISKAHLGFIIADMHEVQCLHSPRVLRQCEEYIRCVWFMHIKYKFFPL